MDDMDGMSMGDMNMGDGVPTPYRLQKVYWAFVGAAIATASLIHIIRLITYKQRLHSSQNKQTAPARPKRLLPSIIATVTALCREIWHASLRPISLRNLKIRLPSLGPVLLVSTYIVIVLVICFYDMDVFDRWQWEDLGYRTGYIATAQLPLVYILAAKNNIIGFIVGKSYERLNWLHRWTARVLFITATIHLIFWFKTWAQYDYILIKLQTDKITQRGFAAWVILLWIVLSSFRPMRSLGYEFFVVQHIVTMAGFSGAIYLHLPSDMKYVFWIGITFPILDRLVRTGKLLWNNVHLRQTSRSRSFFGHPATFDRLSGGATRITIAKPGIKWQAGQHVFLSCHGLIPLQSHPFTIMSLPEDDNLVLIAKAHGGGTRKLYQKAQEQLPLLNIGAQTHLASFEGPYGTTRPLQQFDSIVFLAGSTGCTFTLPLLRSVLTAKTRCTNFVRFVWVVKSREQISWIERELREAGRIAQAMQAQNHNFVLKISIYITCDDEMAGKRLNSEPTTEVGSELSGHDEKAKGAVDVIVSEREGSASEKDGAEDIPTSCQPNGRCCCRTTVEEDDPQTQQRSCNCGPHNKSKSENLDLRPIPSREDNSISSANESLHEHITTLSGRPHVEKLIRETLEQARGESAVVVCGPDGLVDDTRRAVVSLSDERAIHKGTGAQGVYLHTEAFSF